MVNELIEKFLDFDQSTKNEAWAADMVRLVLRDCKPLITKDKYEEGKNVLYGAFPDANYDLIFGSGDAMKRYRKKLSVNSTVYFFERIRNALIDERTQAGLGVTVNSLDPEKQDKKNYDKELLKNRKGLEGLMNKFTANNGMPPKKLDEKDYHGNVEDFDKSGGDEFDMTDINNFFDAYWGLKAELYLQNPINAIFRTNQFTRNFDKYINDILICLHTCSVVYINELDGSQKIEYLAPWEVEVLHASGSNDYKDSGGFNIRKSANVRDFMKKFGTHFNFDRDWQLLLNSVNGNSNHGYTGLSENGMCVWGTSEKLIDFSALLDMPIGYCYTLWKTINKTTKQTYVTPDGNIVKKLVTPENPRVDGCAVEEKCCEETYYAYTLDIGAITPTLIKWGKVYSQQIEGSHDEYSGFPVNINKRDGVPIADILKPLHRIIQVSFKMLEMLVNDIKPDGLILNYSSIVKVAEYLKSAKNVPTDKREGIDLFLQMVEESPNLLADTPEGQEGEVLGGGNLGVMPKKNGLNDAAPEIIKIIDWCEAKASVYLGTEGIELTDPKDGFKLSLENKKRSRASTAFIDFIMLNHMEDISISLMNNSQMIAKYPDLPAYKYMECLVGEKVMKFIGKMKKATHRYGVFLDTFNNDITLMEIRGMAQDARLRNEISLEQYMVLMSIDNPKQAAYYLAYERKKAMKQAQVAAMTALQQQDMMDEKKHKRAMDLQNLIGEWQEKARSQEALGFSNAAAINTKGAMERERLKQLGLDKRATEKANNEINKIQETATNNAQKPVI